MLRDELVTMFRIWTRFLVQVDTSQGSHQAGKDGGTGTPRSGSTMRQASRPRSSAVTVMPTTEPCEVKFVTVQMDGFFPLCSPDQQQKFPARTENWEVQDGVTTPMEPLQHFPTDAFSASSSRCATGPIEIEGPKSPRKTTTSAAKDGDDESYRSDSEKLLAAPSEARLATTNSSPDSLEDRSPQEVLTVVGWVKRNLPQEYEGDSR